ncbi:hypothetical protein GCM10009665_76510 [Kitasatospora nipponensis]|uniref:Uncharacterized protein n=1 Tax=Kitasatospora nipponensis TaxID=258049 RepID=A0ABN1T8K7_9ACTN
MSAKAAALAWIRRWCDSSSCGGARRTGAAGAARSGWVGGPAAVLREAFGAGPGRRRPEPRTLGKCADRPGGRALRWIAPPGRATPLAEPRWRPAGPGGMPSDQAPRAIRPGVGLVHLYLTP